MNEEERQKDKKEMLGCSQKEEASKHRTSKQEKNKDEAR